MSGGAGSSGGWKGWLLFAWTLLAACSSEPPAYEYIGPPPPPPVMLGAVVMQVGPGPTPGVNDSSRCNAVPAPVTMTMGTLWHTLATPDVDDAGAAVRCVVHLEGDGESLDVSGTVSLDGGASFSVAGHVTPDAGTMTGTFVLEGDSYSSQGDCVIVSSDVCAASNSMAGLIECPVTTDEQGHTCFASAQFIFDNCLL